MERIYIEEILLEIFQYLDYRDIKHVQLTCKYWYNICNKSNSLWKKICFDADFSVKSNEDMKRVTGPLPLEMRSIYGCETYEEILDTMCASKCFFQINKFILKNWKRRLFTEESVESNDIESDYLLQMKHGYTDDLFVHSYRKPDDEISLYICIYNLEPFLCLNEFKFVYHKVNHILVHGQYIFVIFCYCIVVYYLNTYLYTIKLYKDKQEVYYDIKEIIEKVHPRIEGCCTRNCMKDYIIQFYKDQIIVCNSFRAHVFIYNMTNGQLNYWINLSDHHKYEGTLYKLEAVKSVQVISNSLILCVPIYKIDDQSRQYELFCIELDETFSLGNVEQNYTTKDNEVHSLEKFINPPILSPNDKTCHLKWRSIVKSSIYIIETTFNRKYIVAFVNVTCKLSDKAEKVLRILDVCTGDTVLETKDFSHWTSVPIYRKYYGTFCLDDLFIWTTDTESKLHLLSNGDKIIAKPFDSMGVKFRIWGNCIVRFFPLPRPSDTTNLYQSHNAVLCGITDVNSISEVNNKNKSCFSILNFIKFRYQDVYIHTQLKYFVGFKQLDNPGRPSSKKIKIYKRAFVF